MKHAEYEQSRERRAGHELVLLTRAVILTGGKRAARGNQKVVIDREQCFGYKVPSRRVRGSNSSVAGACISMRPQLQQLPGRSVLLDLPDKVGVTLYPFPHVAFSA